MTTIDLNDTINKTFHLLTEARKKHVFHFACKEVGSVISVAAGIIKISGLPNVGFEELLKFPGGVFGIAYNLDEDEIGAILLGEDFTIKRR